jgi:hypothetical protein
MKNNIQFAMLFILTLTLSVLMSFSERVNAAQVVQEAKLVAPNGAANDNFSRCVAIDGNTAVVGSYFDDIGNQQNQGSVSIYVKNGGAWNLQQQITASDGRQGDYFGHFVAILGDTILVGAPYDDNDPGNDQGSVYVFRRTGTIWSEQQKIVSPDGHFEQFFGYSLAFVNNTAVIGALGDNGGVPANGRTGAAFIYVFNGTNWTLQQKLAAGDKEPGDEFGWRVAISGESVLIGSFQDTVGTNYRQGSAYVFKRTGTNWSEQQKLTASDGVPEAYFGNSVGISGDTAVISGYIFSRTGNLWTQQQKLLPADSESTDGFGFSSAINADYVVVSSPFDNFGQGSVYVFKNTGNRTLLQKITASDGASDDNFGWHVAILGNTIISGALFDDVGSNANQGSAYIFNILVPTAANASISGRVLSDSGSGISQAVLVLHNVATGETFKTSSDSFGNYRFDEVQSGQIYVLSARHKKWIFAVSSQVLSVYDTIENVNFVATEFAKTDPATEDYGDSLKLSSLKHYGGYGSEEKRKREF